MRFNSKMIGLILFLICLMFSNETFSLEESDEDSSDSVGLPLPPCSPYNTNEQKEQLYRDTPFLVSYLRASRISPAEASAFLAQDALREAENQEKAAHFEMKQRQDAYSQAKHAFRQARQRRLEQETKFAETKANNTVAKREQVATNEVRADDDKKEVGSKNYFDSFASEDTLSTAPLLEKHQTAKKTPISAAASSKERKKKDSKNRK